ncbi:MAG: TIGR00159 family protein [Candidatus Sericytochromatia bacterium]|nr:TIGR00159 family protein [Candidatus Tanganyikabacteria bacterium]
MSTSAILDALVRLLSVLRWQDLLDITIVSLVFYRLFLLIRGTRAVQLLRGLLLLLTAYLVANALQLHTITWLVQSTATMLIVAVPLVFQPELRRALAMLGQGEIFRPERFAAARPDEEVQHLIGELVATARVLTSRKVGALIILERQTGLKEFAETGTAIGAKVSAELLTSLFLPGSPLHDGAVLLRGDRIVAAGALLPLSETIRRSARRPIGTRHRAALGLTETTDALAIVVSEETGALSIAEQGQLHRFLTEDELRGRLEAALMLSRPPVPSPLGRLLLSRR